MRHALLLIAVLGCSSKQPAVEGCAAGTTSLDGHCVPTLDDCDERSVPKLGGGCTTVGITTCAKGFVADGLGGCSAIQPEAPCPPGTRALPGETTCTELVDCGSDPFGSPPGDRILYVDAAATGGDGTRDRPFSSFADAFAAAAEGDTIALAAGSYRFGSVNKPVTIWGRCPQQVSFVGSSGSGAASLFLAAKVKVARIGITGNGVGLGVDGAQGVEIEDVWIHDTPEDGVWIQAPRADTSVTFRNVLVEKVHDTGIGSYGATTTIERSVVRDVAPGAGGIRGSCVALETHADRKKPSTGVISDSVFERCHDAGIAVFGSDATIERVVVRDMFPNATNQMFGNGISVVSDETLHRAGSTIIRDAFVSNVLSAGIFVQRSSARLERVSVVDTRSQVSNKGIGSALYGAQGGSFEAFDSYFARNHHVALLFTGNAHVERSVVRDVTPDEAGVGGVGIAGVPLKVDSALVLDVIDSAVLHTQVSAVSFLGVTGSVRGCHIRDVKPGTGGYGDGIDLEPWTDVSFADTFLPAKVTIERTLVAEATRAGALVLGDCKAALASSVLRCNGIDLAVGSKKSPAEDVPPGALGGVRDDSGNLCGCDSARECLAQQSDLTPIELRPE